MRDYKEELNNLDNQEPQETVRREVDLSDGLNIDLNLDFNKETFNTKIKINSFQEIHKPLDIILDDGDCFLELSTTELLKLIQDELDGDFNELLFDDGDEYNDILS